MLLSSHPTVCVLLLTGATFLHAIRLPDKLLNSVPLVKLEACLRKLTSTTYQSKAYSGIRQSNTSELAVRWFDQTVAIVELEADADRTLSCEIIEMTGDEDRERLVNTLSDIASTASPVNFDQMIELMAHCQYVDQQNDVHDANDEPTRTAGTVAAGVLRSVLGGIVPGTKWCGTGDRALSYADLGVHRTMDRCCRAHDLCPMKVLARQRRYGLHNAAVYTKSHCRCDAAFYACLRAADSTAAATVEAIYFRLVRVPCVSVDATGVAEWRKASTNGLADE